MGLAVYFLALAITLAVELPLVGAFVGRADRAHVWRTALVLNLFTHPLANLAHWEGLASPLAIEVLVMLVEAIGYGLLLPFTFRRALGVSVLANTLTGLGSLLFL